MKQRLTYLVRDPSKFSLEKVSVTADSLTVQNLDAAKEQHLTLGLSELPQEIQEVLKQCHELHLRGASPSSYEGVSPYVSRVSPGLHAFFTPRREESADLLCPVLKKLLGDGLKCESPEATFVHQPIRSERFSSSSSYSYYQVLSDAQWDHLITYLSGKSCRRETPSCQQAFDEIRKAQYVDLDYDTISHAVILKPYWAHPPAGGGGWSETTQIQPSMASVEIGILNSETPDETEELKLGGFLAVLGQDSEPKATLFSFPARHHPLPASSTRTSYSISLKQPTGLHPSLQIDFPPDSLTPPANACALHTYLTLPSYLFIDKYQFDDELFLAEHNLRQLHSIAGATDLEAPDWVIPQWGSSALFELAHPISPQALGTAFRNTIPLHLRYLQPTNATDGISDVSVPWPVVFWACKAEEGLKMGSSPFDRVNLGYDGLFGPRTMFYHVPPQSGAYMIETVRVPVLKLGHARLVEVGTIVAVLAGFAWVVWKLLKVVMSDRLAEVDRDAGGKKKQ